MSSGIYLSADELSKLSPATQKELKSLVFSTQASALAEPSTDEEASPAGSESEEEPPDLSPAQARKLVAGCSDRPKAALRFIAEQATPRFSYKQLVGVIGKDSSGTIRGTLAAITRRTRTVLGDTDAELIWYDEDEQDGWIGYVSDATHTSLRKAFNLA